MNWSGRRVLVTGAGGFIGSHLAERLADLGAHVRAFVHYHSDGSWGLLDDPLGHGMEIFAGDIRDRDCVRDAMSGCEVVFHLCSLIAIPYSYRAIESYMQTNATGALNVLQAAREFGVERVIHTSTSECYGTAQYVPIDEQHPIAVQSPYAASKAAADMLATSFHRSFGTPVAIVRPFNTFGPRQSARAIVPTIISQALSGNPIRLGNLHPTRDLNYVADTVDGFIKAAECEAAIGRVVNIGSGREISIGELLGLIADMMGCHAVLALDRERIRPESSEVDRLLCDNRLAKSLLGWEARYSLEDGLRATIEWMEEHRDSYRPAAYAV